LVEAAVKTTLIRNEASALRFASFLARFSGWPAAVKGRDERPSGALDSPLRDRWKILLSLALDMADDFIDACFDQYQQQKLGSVHPTRKLSLKEQIYSRSLKSSRTLPPRW
jgi:hypothetical protein